MGLDLSGCVDPCVRVGLVSGCVAHQDLNERFKPKVVCVLMAFFGQMLCIGGETFALVLFFV